MGHAPQKFVAVMASPRLSRVNGARNQSTLSWSITDDLQRSVQDEITTLNTLTATLIDSVNGYEDAPPTYRGQQPLTELFRKRQTSALRVEELRGEVRRLGGDAEDGGSFLGKTHQRFHDLKAAITGRDEKAIINEVERGEDYLKEKFETALQTTR